ncbi:MAG: hypothetical protein ACJ04O_03410 [Cellvibrionales bacterium]|nr:hypothetical protein [Porticoccaceae bacterium]|tara:strand:+ start:3657 stop:3830 length:174 start_codon:yes stop_codon:yes gene_type:complete
MHRHYSDFFAPELKLHKRSIVSHLAHKSARILVAAKGLQLTGELAALGLFMNAFIAT